MDTHRPHVTVDHAKCTPCEGLICVGICPQAVLEPDENNKPQVTNPASCTQCGICADLCPTKAIKVTKTDKSKNMQ